MSLQLSAVPTSIKVAKQDTNRRSANFHPSIWGDHFLSYASNSVEAADEKKLQDLKEEIKRILKANVNKPAEKLDLVDRIQRLGVSYHFQTDIDQILEKAYEAHQDSGLKDENDYLYSISLEFRLLRQHGYNISCDVFNNLKDINGNFKKSLVKDIRGMLSLYEATHLRVHGESILDEALAFTTTYLEPVATQFSSPLAAQVNNALNRPLRKSLPRLGARYYMPIYQDDHLHDEILLKFAKLDFNMSQKVHQKELSDITRWWKTLDVENNLPFVRDRVVELYFWTLGVYFEPDYGLARRFLTKVTAMCSITDDIYDACGTIEELELFTTAIERWDINAMEPLPEYMKIAYRALLDVYDEIEKDMVNQGRLYRLDYAKEAMKILVRNYNMEARWCNQNYVPTMEEYFSVALPSCGYLTLAATSFLGMGDIVTKESFEWVLSNPKIVKASSIICRLMDDTAGHKDEQQRQHVASAVECYMKHHGTSEEEVVKLFGEQVKNAWKDINEEFIKPTTVPMPLLERVLNLARVMDLLYKEADCYTNSHLMKDHVASLLRDPVQL
ncbi:(-)-germacrene D synthase-like [Pistacia vera]|uniref:(-)-germacrene D synthase-like n=1 Tax=Pistacia vera TaxID=55513 RepID=UPI001263550A|nr:(-)-germacrene D synthase-like [Pistacia vera]